jgi:plasmid stability protein
LTKYGDNGIIGDMGNIIIKDVPENLKREFKAICAIKGKSLKEEIIRLMRKEVETERKDKL